MISVMRIIDCNEMNKNYSFNNLINEANANLNQIFEIKEKNKENNFK